ncbi:formate dehydrogenase subunit delta [Pseudorhodobacter antarcticus]|jgi:formate dehydrogenase subunit delta|uniref:Formate dehydrogenase subunit delta n=1 Tax=Pseudorhodobacter antarcticus TaxID=1077947 RepID=A0A1H8GYR8_9RHOB|nr:formate dehydrogenase subunit delta [Pseudorhodobacter antarcticus]SEN48647.1 formate dehydrogenase subunit delta [Pseudorhodobacter antarcticus]
MSPEKMVYMTNQIATYFKTQADPDRAGKIADHLSDFWEPRMLEKLYAHVDSGGAGMDPLVVEAAQRVRRAKAA